MARIILLLTGAFITVLAVPMYFVLCIWIAIFEEYERGSSEKGRMTMIEIIYFIVGLAMGGAFVYIIIKGGDDIDAI